MMPQQIDPQIINRVRLVWPFLKDVFLKAGISFAMVAAAAHLIPDHAVMSKEELEGKTEVTEKELFIRKAAIPGIIVAGCKLPSQLKSVFLLSTNPGIQNKLLAFARVLMMTPVFLLAYQILKRKIENQEPTLNIREIMKDSPISQNTAASIAGVGVALSGTTVGVNAALHDIAAAKAAQNTIV